MICDDVLSSKGFGTPNTGGSQILLINELVRRRQQQLERPRLGHHCNDLCKRTQVDFTFARQNSAFRLEVQFGDSSATAFETLVVSANISATAPRCCGSRMNWNDARNART